MGKHILVISQYFYPEPFRINDICQEWVKLGGSIAVGVFAPMAVNLAWLCFKTADGKPIFKFKKNEDSLK